MTTTPGSPGDGLPLMPPDLIEEFGPELDNVVPSLGYRLAPMVGIGGSAGSIAALQTFFHTMPVDSGMSFMVVLHVSPPHHSAMAELLGRATTMPVFQAVNGQKVEPNHVSVIPRGNAWRRSKGSWR